MSYFGACLYNSTKTGKKTILKKNSFEPLELGKVFMGAGVFEVGHINP